MQRRDKTFGEGVGAEKQRGVKGVSSEGVPEEWSGAEERCCADAENGSSILQEAADEDAEEKTGVNNGDEFVEADEDVAEKEGEKRKKKSEAAVTQDGAGEKRHGAHGREIPWVRGDAQGGGEQDHTEREQRAIEQTFILRNFRIHFVSSISGNKSQNTKPSRFTTSPVRTGMGEWKMGPSKTKVWNSPFSPHGSAWGGRSRKKDSSSSRPAKLGERTLVSMHAAMARKRCW